MQYRHMWTFPLTMDPFERSASMKLRRLLPSNSFLPSQLEKIRESNLVLFGKEADSKKFSFGVVRHEDSAEITPCHVSFIRKNCKEKCNFELARRIDCEIYKFLGRHLLKHSSNCAQANVC